MKRKVISLSLILVIVMTLMSNVYAASKCKVNFEMNRTEYNVNDEIIVDVVLSNIQDEKGIIALGAVLDYGSSLELVKMEPQGDWTKPSYNEANRKFAIDRDNNYATKDETMFTITFKVKSDSKKDITIALKDIVASNGKEDIKVDNVSKSITIKNSTVPDKKPDNTVSDNNIGNNTGNNVGNNSGNKVNNNNSIFNGKIPQTGENSPIIIFCIIALIAVVVVYFVKIKIINKKAKNNK